MAVLGPNILTLGWGLRRPLCLAGCLIFKKIYFVFTTALIFFILVYINSSFKICFNVEKVNSSFFLFLEVVLKEICLDFIG